METEETGNSSTCTRFFLVRILKWRQIIQFSVGRPPDRQVCEQLFAKSRTFEIHERMQAMLERYTLHLTMQSSGLIL
jgi:hypothetical protein